MCAEVLREAPPGQKKEKESTNRLTDCPAWTNRRSPDRIIKGESTIRLIDQLNVQSEKVQREVQAGYSRVTGLID